MKYIPSKNKFTFQIVLYELLEINIFYNGLYFNFKPRCFIE